jgi:hypothetical protein
LNGLLFHFLADRIGLRRRAPAPLPDVEKARISASITTQKIAGSLDGNFLGGSPERRIFLRTTLS